MNCCNIVFSEKDSFRNIRNPFLAVLNTSFLLGSIFLAKSPYNLLMNTPLALLASQAFKIEINSCADSLISPMSYDDTLKQLRTDPPTKVFGRDASKCIIPWKMTIGATMTASLILLVLSTTPLPKC